MSDPRNKITDCLERILIGPKKVDEVAIGREPLLNYVSGKLFARDTDAGDVRIEDYEELEGESSDDASIDSSAFGPDANDPVSLSFQQLPSSAGISFCLKDESELLIEISAGIYLKQEREDLEKENGKQDKKGKKEFKREELKTELTVKITKNKRKNLVDDCLEGRAQISVRVIPWRDCDIITVTLVNTQDKSKNTLDSTLFQVWFKCTPKTKKIKPYPVSENILFEEEEKEFELRYRDKRPFARGWNVSVDWEMDENQEEATSVETTYFPKEYVHRVFTTLPEVADQAFLHEQVFSLAYLADEESDKTEIIQQLKDFADYFETWIKTLDSADLDEKLVDVGQSIKSNIGLSLSRIREGIQALDDEEVFASFQLANLSMLIQMSHFDVNKTEGGPFKLDKAHSLENLSYLENHKFNWYPFQLAYFLLVLSSLVDEGHEYRETVDLIWFQTGGGKTEAYFFVSAFEMIYRRVKDGKKGLGTAIINRYTYRFLTTDQFTRTAALICALERIRRRNPTDSRWADKLTSVPFTLGLWVGGDVTPNKLKNDLDKENIDKSANGRIKTMKDTIGTEYFINFFQIESCPSCATRLFPETDERDDNNEIKEALWGFRLKGRNFHVVCPSHDCLFHGSDQGTALPLLMVDESIYQDPPTFLIGTIDKFANLAWQQASGKLIGQDTKTLPPSLIIQDELHLISGSLGTLAAIYESAVDTVISQNGQKKPKYIAATATIRNSSEQCRRIFARNCKIFPSPGLTMEDSFFATVDKNPQNSRLYSGLMSSGVKTTVASYKIMAAMLQAINEIDLTDEEKDAFWTLLAYHNSKRELGRTISTYGDEIPAQIQTYAETEDKIRQLRGEYFEISANAVKSISDARSALMEKHDPPETMGYDFVPCTNMVSVGIDIQRLSYMFVNGHPKLNAEYIQATSRVGRSNISGLIVTNYSAFKPRDRSFYEQFKNFHMTIHRSVEPTTVTPGARSAMKKALHAALIIVVRFASDLRKNDDAIRFNQAEYAPLIADFKTRLRSCYTSTDAEQTSIANELDALVSQWEGWADTAKSRDKPLDYSSRSKERWGLMRSMSISKQYFDVGWHTLFSMRHVDQEINLKED